MPFKPRPRRPWRLRPVGLPAPAPVCAIADAAPAAGPLRILPGFVPAARRPVLGAP